MLCGHGQPLFWGDTAQCHVWALVIVRPHPLRGSLLNVFQVILQSIPMQGTINSGALPMQAISTAAGVGVQVRNNDNTPSVFNQDIGLAAYNPAPRQSLILFP